MPIIHICTIGKWKRAEEKQLFEQYCKRCNWKIELHELAGLVKLPLDERKKRETELLIECSQQRQVETIFALDETGAHYSSVEFANKINGLCDSGVRKLGFLIGGDVGMDMDIIRKINAISFSFGAMTWPHLLVRVLLAEQIYRAQTIISNHPYHRI